MGTSSNMQRHTEVGRCRHILEPSSMRHAEMRRTQLRATPLGSLDDLLFERMRFSARCYLHLHCLSFSTVTKLSSSWPGLPRAHESRVVKPPLLKFTMVTSHISHAQARSKPRSMMVRLREVRTEIRHCACTFCQCYPLAIAQLARKAHLLQSGLLGRCRPRTRNTQEYVHGKALLLWSPRPGSKLQSKP